MHNLTIRSAEPLDADWILPELKNFSEFVGTKKKLFGNEDYVRTQVLNVMKNHLLLVAEKEDKTLIGFIGGFFVPHYFNPEIKTLTELAWWVVPSERRSAAGFLLMQGFIDFGKKNSDWIAFGLNEKTPVKPEKLIELGFQPFEHSFLMEV